LRDVVGLYVDPPAQAIVLSVDEKSQIQALDRTQPGLPLKKGCAGTMTHDYEDTARRAEMWHHGQKQIGNAILKDLDERSLDLLGPTHPNLPAH
jgi:hypothetical protein